MKIHSFLPMATAALAFSAPLSAETSQDIFARLAEPIKTAPVSPDAIPAVVRSRAIPALGLLPYASDFALAVPHAGAKLACVVTEYDENGNATPSKQVQSVGSVAISVGSGGAKSLAAVYAVLLQYSQGSSAIPMLKEWSSVASAQANRIILEELQAQSELQNDKFRQKMGSTHLAPVYAAITAEPGQESAFEGIQDKIMDSILRHDRNCEKVDLQGFSGIKVRQIDLFRDELKKQLCNDPQKLEIIEEILSARDVYVLAKKMPGVMLVAVCEDTAELSWPTDSADSLLHARELAGLDARPDTLQMIAWSKPDFVNALMAVVEDASANQSECRVAANIFDRLSLSDAANSPVFKAAADGLKHIVKAFSVEVPASQKPSIVQVWNEGADVIVEMQSDASGNSYEPAVLHHVNMADAKDTILYQEISGIRMASKISLSGVLNALTDVVKGVVTSLNEPLQDETSVCVQTAEQFLPEIMQFGDALATLERGIKSPFSFVIADSDVEESLPMLALTWEVADRSKIGEGWQDALRAVGRGIEKAGGSSEMLMLLPIMPQSLDGSRMSYTLAFPLLTMYNIQAQSVVSDEEFTLSTHKELSSRLAQTTGSMPFCGVVMALHLEPLARSIGRWDPSIRKDMKRHVLSVVDSVYAVSTIQDGVSITRILIHRPTGE